MNLLFIYHISFLSINEILLDKSIVLFTYNSFGLPDNSLYINNIKYRESCIQSEQTGIFALELNPNTYSFETKYNSLEINKFTNYKTIISNQHQLNNIIINNNTLVSHEYYSQKKHYLYIVYQINLLPQYNNQSILFDVKINNNIIHSEKTHSGF